MRIRPLQGQVLVEMLPADDTVGSLALPDVAQETPTKAIVRELGPWPLNRKGNMIPYDFKKGNTVLVSKYSGIQMNRNIGEKFKMVPWDKIVAVIG